MNRSQVVKSFNWWGLIPLILVVWLYGAAIRLPFFSDDVIHFRGTSQTSLHEILTQVQIGAYYLRYYRPVVNLILYVQWQLGIQPSAPLWHGIILFTHLTQLA
jgi:hypothetical protein